MYILYTAFLCILLFINDVITMQFIDVNVRAYYIYLKCNLTLNYVLIFSGIYCKVLKCLYHLTCNV